MKNDTYYFPHDFNARNDKKLVKLRQVHKQTGIGIYWSLVEMLYEENGILSLNDVPVLSSELRAKIDMVDSVIRDFGLFENDEEYFWSNSVKRRMDKRLEKSEKAKASASHRWQNANAMRTHTDGNAIKERKGKENKGKERIAFIPPTLEEMKKFFTENDYPEWLAEKAFKGYDVAGWKDTNGKKIINWKQKMINVWFKQENKIVSFDKSINYK